MSNGCKACNSGPGTLGKSLINVNATHREVLPLGCVVAIGCLSILPICYEETYNTQPLHLLSQPIPLSCPS